MFNLLIATPLKVVFSGEVQYATLPGGLGYMGILQNHAPLISTLQKGKIEITMPSGEKKAFEVAEGVMEIKKNEVVVLTDELKN